MNNNRACEICGKTDVKTAVCGSNLGAISFNYCRICAAMNAEIPAILDTIGKKEIKPIFSYYDKESDTYRDYITDKEHAIIFKDGTICNTRAEAVIKITK